MESSDNQEASTDYHIDQDLESLFHADLQDIQLEPENSDHDDVIGDHLPEWLIGVIIVVSMLVVAFFVMIITSLVKSRKKARSNTYNGPGSSVSDCDDLESGKVSRNENGMKMTSFAQIQDGTDRNGLTKTPEIELNLKEGTVYPFGSMGQNTLQEDPNGCKNPLFVDDDGNTESQTSGDGPESSSKPKQDSGVDAKKTYKLSSKKPNVLQSPSLSNTKGAMIKPRKESGHKHKPSSFSQTIHGKTIFENGSNTTEIQDKNDSKRKFVPKAKSAHRVSNRKEKGKHKLDEQIPEKDETIADGEDIVVQTGENLNLNAIVNTENENSQTKSPPTGSQECSKTGVDQSFHSSQDCDMTNVTNNQSDILTNSQSDDQKDQHSVNAALSHFDNVYSEDVDHSNMSSLQQKSDLQPPSYSEVAENLNPQPSEHIEFTKQSLSEPLETEAERRHMNSQTSTFSETHPESGEKIVFSSTIETNPAPDTETSKGVDEILDVIDDLEESPDGQHDRDVTLERREHPAVEINSTNL